MVYQYLRHLKLRNNLTATALRISYLKDLTMGTYFDTYDFCYQVTQLDLGMSSKLLVLRAVGSK